MIDIFNEARTSWRNMGDATKAEIERQEKAGATVQWYWLAPGKWVTDQSLRATRLHLSYRIEPGTEVPPMSTRPEAERDIHNLTTPPAFLHDAIWDELDAWDRGWEYWDGKEWKMWRGPIHRGVPCPIRAVRHKPDLIERIKKRNFPAYDDVCAALLVADALIRDFDNADNRKAYEEAKK